MRVKKSVQHSVKVAAPLAPSDLNSISVGPRSAVLPDLKPQFGHHVGMQAPDLDTAFDGHVNQVFFFFFFPRFF